MTVKQVKQQTYTTKEIAGYAGIHVNTVRFYEQIGFITKPQRANNGYRVYTQLQLDQCVFVRIAMRAEILQNGLRKKAVEVVRLCAELDFDGACDAAEAYRCMISREIRNAKAAITAVENQLNSGTHTGETLLNRKEAAEALDVTSETLRTWERSGLLTVNRRANGYRVYNSTDMERLNIIRTLRCANYSLTAILRLLHGLDRNESRSVESMLNTPGEQEDIISVCDRLLVSLHNTEADAKILIDMINTMNEKYHTIQ